jgi:hypothetical protein
MSIETSGRQGHDYDFNAIDAAVRETERGRWFLAEYDRRSRSADTQSLLDAIGKLEKLVKATPQQRHPSGSRLDVAQAIRNTKAEIEAVQNSLFPDADAIAEGCNSFSYLTVQAKSIAAEISQFCEVLQSISDSVKDNPEEMAGALAHVSQRLLHIGSSQDVLAKRVAKAVELLLSLDREIGGEIARSADIVNQLEKLAEDAPRPALRISDENLKYFSKDEELFAAETPKLPQALSLSSPPERLAAASESSTSNHAVADTNPKARIVIVRTPSLAAQSIPLADDTPDTPPRTAA